MCSTSVGGSATLDTRRSSALTPSAPATLFRGRHDLEHILAPTAVDSGPTQATRRKSFTADRLNVLSASKPRHGAFTLRTPETAAATPRTRPNGCWNCARSLSQQPEEPRRSFPSGGVHCRSGGPLGKISLVIQSLSTCLRTSRARTSPAESRSRAEPHLSCDGGTDLPVRSHQGAWCSSPEPRRTPRSNLATYTVLSHHGASCYAATRPARRAMSRRFSFIRQGVVRPRSEASSS